MGLALIAAGIVALIVGGILTKRFSSRGSGPMASTSCARAGAIQ